MSYETWREYFLSKDFLDSVKAERERCTPKIKITLANEVNFTNNKNEKR